MNSSNAPSLSDTTIIATASTSVNLVLSLPINSYVVWLIATRPGGTLVAEFIPLNLAVFEILFCLLSAFIPLRHILPPSSPVEYLVKFEHGFLWSGRPMLQCCICIEQFLAVVHPVLFLRYKTLRYKGAFSAVTWVVIIGFSVFYLLSPKIKHLVFVSECLVLISVMLFCYFSVFVALKRPPPGEGKKGRDNLMKRRAFLTILVIIVSFVGTYLLWCIIIISNLSSWVSPERRLMTKIAICITFVSGFVQPLLYLQRTQRISGCKAV